MANDARPCHLVNVNPSNPSSKDSQKDEMAKLSGMVQPNAEKYVRAI